MPNLRLEILWYNKILINEIKRRGREEMPKPIELPEILQREDFDELYRREKHPRVKMRYLAMSLLKKGKSHREVGEILQVHEKTVLKWVRILKAKGTEGLKEQGGRGRKPRLDPEKYEEVKQAILECQRNLKGGRICGKDVRKLLQEQFGVELSVNRIYELLHIMGLSWVSARSQHPKAEPARQEALKKTSEKKKRFCQWM
jgi:transposase